MRAFANLDRTKAAIEWILRARQASGDGGISKGYHILRRRWAPSYPETTAYTISTLLNAAELLQRPDLLTVARGLGSYLSTRVGSQGGLAHWAGRADQPIVFDTGQAIFGWLALYDACEDSASLEAAVRAGSWLVRIQDPSGAWTRHQHLGVSKVIDARVSWALLELYQRTNLEQFRRAAIRNLDWVVEHQTVNGWFRRCAFDDRSDPSTHTLAYTADGLLESSRILGVARYSRAARLTANALLQRQRADGGLASSYSPSWNPTSRSSCLTGNCQIAHLWLRCERESGDAAYRAAANRAFEFVATTQKLGDHAQEVRGAISGSYPIYGRYERFAYPNWAAKFFVDAALALHSVENGLDWPRYVG